MRLLLLAITTCFFLIPVEQIKAQTSPKLITTVEGIKEYELSERAAGPAYSRCFANKYRRQYCL
jgi:hypothetical protein